MVQREVAAEPCWAGKREVMAMAAAAARAGARVAVVAVVVPKAVVVAVAVAMSAMVVMVAAVVVAVGQAPHTSIQSSHNRTLIPSGCNHNPFAPSSHSWIRSNSACRNSARRSHALC